MGSETLRLKDKLKTSPISHVFLKEEVGGGGLARPLLWCCLTTQLRGLRESACSSQGPSSENCGN